MKAANSIPYAQVQNTILHLSLDPEHDDLSELREILRVFTACVRSPVQVYTTESTLTGDSRQVRVPFMETDEVPVQNAKESWETVQNTRIRGIPLGEFLRIDLVRVAFTGTKALEAEVVLAAWAHLIAQYRLAVFITGFEATLDSDNKVVATVGPGLSFALLPDVTGNFCERVIEYATDQEKAAFFQHPGPGKKVLVKAILPGEKA